MNKEYLKKLTENVIDAIDGNVNLESYGLTIESLACTNLLKEIILCIEFWHIRNIPVELLNKAIDAHQDDDYETIYEVVSNIWLEKANTEIESVIDEIEKATE